MDHLIIATITETITNFISSWYINLGYVGIVLAMAIESCCIPLPSEIVMPLAGVFVVTCADPSQQCVNNFSLLGVAIAGTVGCLIGSIVAYGIGRSGGRPMLLKYGRYVLISQADSDRADRWFARFGPPVAFFSRLLPVVRTYISLPAGIYRMNFLKFCIYTLLGSFPWCLLLAFIGTRLGSLKNLEQLSTPFHGADIVILVVIVALVALYIYRHIKHDRAARAALAARMAQAQQERASWHTSRPERMPRRDAGAPGQPYEAWNQEDMGGGRGYPGNQRTPDNQQWTRPR
jgi:membrane protein DedA with SNARE-associated domain